MLESDAQVYRAVASNRPTEALASVISFTFVVTTKVKEMTEASAVLYQGRSQKKLMTEAMSMEDL